MAIGLGVAVAVFIADRVSQSSAIGPEEASASVRDSLSDELGKQMRATAALTNIPPAPRTLSDRLADLAKTQGLDPADARDAFCPSRAWIARPDPAAYDQPSVQGDLAELRARQFARRHKLTATAVGGDGAMAIIDGRCLVVGREMDGMKLVSVDRSSATLRGGGVEVKLPLAKE